MMFPPSSTWLSLLSCIAFQVGVSLLCLHKKGSELAHRGPAIFSRWFNRRRRGSTDESDSALSSASLKPPTSVAQSWRLGALHERFFKGQHGDAETLREAGNVLGVGRSLTEVELLSLARVAERTPNRSRWCCNVADCMLIAAIIGIISTIGPALYYLATPIHPFVKDVFAAVAKLVRWTPSVVLSLIVLSISFAVVCDGFRAADKDIGGRIALTGVAGGIATMFFSTLCAEWVDDSPYVFARVKVAVLFFFTAAVVAPVAVKFDSALSGFLAASAAFVFGVASISDYSEVDSYELTWVIPPLCGSLTVDALFCCAVLFRVKTQNLQPFASGTMAMGVFALHLILYMYSFMGVYPAHVLVQLPVYSALVATWILGKTIGCNGLVNNAYLFGVIYVFSSAVSLTNKLPGNGGSAVGWAAVSFGSWRCAMYLHGHRDFLSSLWTLDAGLFRAGPDAGADGNSERGRSGGEDHEPLLGEGPVFEMETEMTAGDVGRNSDTARSLSPESGLLHNV